MFQLVRNVDIHDILAKYVSEPPADCITPQQLGRKEIEICPSREAKQPAVMKTSATVTLTDEG